MQGETGLNFAYDGLYRPVYGETHDGTGSLTETDNAFDTLGGLERQRQRVLRPHPNFPNADLSEHMVSAFDESGRRWQRTSAGGNTEVDWKFDRKHRATESGVQKFSGGGWTPRQVTAQYQYLGGGLLHSRQTRFHPGDTARPILSEISHDDLLRVAAVRHTRDDGPASGGAFGERLFARYEYAYDANSMMQYEARWWENDQDGASVNPDETDLYEYDSLNNLQKAVYSVAKDGAGNAVNTGALLSQRSAMLDDNAGTYSDRVLYGRRKTGTRAKVNWSRGTAARTDAPLTARPDETHAPDQTTNYTTTESATADGDNPAADGQGSRHNYTVIGQIGHTYDNNRNVLADGSREFRYNYKNQLRSVWRKSDGQGHGQVAKYREDAFGRQVYAESWWELSRRVYFDTRFELDVYTDADRDRQKMALVDGGMQGTTNATYAADQQTASWPSRINKAVAGVETHYADFVVDVPADVGPASNFWGQVSYHNWEVRIYGNRYELWQTGGGAPLATFNATATGRRHIGICAGFDAPGVWVDGVQVISATIPAVNNPIIGFGSKAWDDPATFQVVYVPGATLLENLCYLKSFHRAETGEPATIPGQPVVHVTTFDGPRPSTVNDICTSNGNWSPLKVVEVGACGGRVSVAHGATTETTISLATGRRVAGVLITDNVDGLVYADGELLENPEGPAPGVSTYVFTDAVGTSYCYDRVLADLPADPGTYGNEAGGVSGTTPATPNNELFYIPIGLGVHTGPTGRGPEPTSATPWVPDTTVGSPLDTRDGTALNADKGDGICPCGSVAPNIPTTAVVTNDSSTGLKSDYLGGFGDFPPGIMFADPVIPLEGDGWGGQYNPKTGEVVIEEVRRASKDHKGEIAKVLGQEVRIPSREPRAGPVAGVDNILPEGVAKETVKCLVGDAVEGAKDVGIAAALTLLGPVGIAINVYRGCRNTVELAKNALEGAKTLINEEKRNQLVEDLKTDVGKGRAVASGVQIISTAFGGIKLFRAVRMPKPVPGSVVGAVDDAPTAPVKSAASTDTCGPPVAVEPPVRPVKPGDTGTYGELKRQKQLYGETEPLDMDHQPSFAAQKARAEADLGRKLTDAEIEALRQNTPSIASPRRVHQRTSPTYGGRNTPQKIAEDMKDLEAARKRDRAAFDKGMEGR